MAERRMFAKTIIDSDSFLDMPLSSQTLYFHLGMRADDDGFINNPRKIQRMIGANDDDLNLLLLKGFILKFKSNVIVVTHWKIHNYIQKDRYHGTRYVEEKNLLHEKENREYTICIQDVHRLDTQVSVGEERQDKVSLEEFKCSLGKENLTFTDYNLLTQRYSKNIIDMVIKRIMEHPYINCLNILTIETWSEEAIKQKNSYNNVKKNSFNEFQQSEYDFNELDETLPYMRLSV